jgi:hypothetical protein
MVEQDCNVLAQKEPFNSIQSLLSSALKSRDSPMTDEERQRALDFIVAQSAKNSVEIEKLSESHRKGERRLDRAERILELLIRAGSRARRDFDQRFARVTDAIAALVAAQSRTEASNAHTDKRLDALIDIVRAERNGRS